MNKFKKINARLERQSKDLNTWNDSHAHKLEDSKLVW